MNRRRLRRGDSVEITHGILTGARGVVASVPVVGLRCGFPVVYIRLSDGFKAPTFRAWLAYHKPGLRGVNVEHLRLLAGRPRYDTVREYPAPVCGDVAGV